MSKVEGTYRKSTSGTKVKFDKDPSNNYTDGYGAGRRFEKKYHFPYFLIGVSIGMILELVLWVVATNVRY